MDMFEILKKRRSIREYKDKPIPKQVIEQIIDAARFAPTARMVEPWEFVVITEPSMLEKIAGICENGRFITKAKACIAVFCQETKYYLEDGCAATENILLAATGLGVGSCWVAGDKKAYCLQISSLLGVPQNFRLVSMVALGYPDSKNALKAIDRRSLDDMLHWEKFI